MTTNYFKLHRDDCPKAMKPLFFHMPVILFRDRPDRKKMFWVEDCSKKEDWIKMGSETVKSIPRKAKKIEKEDFCGMTGLSW